MPGPLGWGSTGGRISEALTDDEVVEVVRRAADPLQARHVSADYANLYRRRQELIRRAVASADQDSRTVDIGYGQLERKWKHAPDLFGLPPNGNPRLWPQFDLHLRGFVTAPTTVRVSGTHRGVAANLYIDVVDMKRVVVVRSSGEFWSAWILSPTQARHVWERHALQ